MKTLVVSIALALSAGSSFASQVDPVESLIRQQTDLTSSAGQAGDQATVDRLTSDQVLFSAGDGTVQREPKFDVDDDVARQLRVWTEMLHGEHPSSAAPVVAASALLVDEKGVLNSHNDFSAGASTISDWVVHHTKSVAVSSFTLRSGDQRFVAVEIWSHHKRRWSLVGGQTIALHDDPTAIDLSTETLNGYAGSYSAGPGSLVVISSTADGLTSTPRGGAPRVLKPEANDLFYTPGLAAGYLRPTSYFVRDASGNIVGYRSSGIYFEKIDGASASTGPAPIAGALKLRDFQVHRVGDVAVAAFFHDRDTSYYGQTLHQTFQSMEAWINDHGTWKMISSQGCQV